MDKTPLRVCRHCRANKVNMLKWILGRRICNACITKEVLEDVQKELNEEDEE